MNIKDTFLLPWKTAHTGMCWLVLLMLAAAVIGVTALSIFSHKPDMWVLVAGIIGLAQALGWPLCLGSTILLTIDAQQLRMPGIQRQAVAGVVLNVVSGVLVPALVIGWFGGHTLATAALIAMLLVAGLLYSLLPRYVAMAFYLAGVVVISGKFLRQWPTYADFLDWAWPVLAAEVAAVAFCWRRLVLAPNPYRLSQHSPMALRLSRGMSAAGAGRIGMAQIDRRPEWLQARGDLRRCGPGHPVTSLRMALGGPYMPLTGMGWLRRFAVAVAAIAGFVVWIAFVVLRGGTLTAIRDGDGIVLLMLCGAGASVLYAVTCLTDLGIRWRSVNAELPLLALLPELGGNVKRDLLRAALWPPLSMLLLAGMLVLTVLTAIGARRDMFALLVVMGAAGLVTAVTLRVVGGCKSERWEAGAGAVLALLLLVGTLLAGMFSIDASTPPADLNMLCTVLLVGWLAAAVMLFRVSRRGWHALQQRPHPFLPNG